MTLPRRRRRRASLAALAILIATLAAPVAAAPKVVASIVPVHSLAALVMADVGTPELLVRGGASPHSYAMRPSDARMVEQADVIVWVGPMLESYLDKAMRSLPRQTRIVTLTREAGIELRAGREGGAWDVHDHDHGHDHGHGAKGRKADRGLEMDHHVWLDPDNARRIVARLAAVLAEIDPANAQHYAANAAAAADRIAALDSEIAASLAPVRHRPFVVFHDAYQYFERHYGLNAVGSVTVSPERQPSAKRLNALRAKITRLGARCVFAEPQFEPTLVRTVVEKTDARTGVLDPEGTALAPGAAAWFTLMRGLRDSLVSCLGETS